MALNYLINGIILFPDIKFNNTHFINHHCNIVHTLYGNNKHINIW